MSNPDIAIAITALFAQGLKEIGIPSPGVTQGALVYAGYRLALGDYLSGSLIIVAVCFGSVCGALLAYNGGRFFANHFCKYLHLTPEKLDHLKSKLERGSFFTVMLGRFIPALMAPLSIAAGMLHLPPRRFSGGIALAMFLWTVFFVAGGAIFGEAFDSFQMPAGLPLLAAGIIGAGMLSSLAIYLWRRKHATKNTNAYRAGEDKCLPV